jgi:hypothetical protein
MQLVFGFVFVDPCRTFIDGASSKDIKFLPHPSLNAPTIMQLFRRSASSAFASDRETFR